MPPRHRSREGFLPRLVLISGDHSAAEVLPLRLLTCAHGIDVVALRQRVGADGAPLLCVDTGSVDAGPAATAHTVQAGDRFPARELVEKLTGWEPAMVVLRGDVELGDALDGVRDVSVLRDGWVGPTADILAVEKVVAELASIPSRSGAVPKILVRASAPVYANDSHADLERRGRELAYTLLRETLFGVAKAGAGDAAPEPPRPWPLGTSRLRVVFARERRRLLRRLTDPAWLVKNLAAIVYLVGVAPIRALWRTLSRTHPIHVFTFHRVSELCRDGMTIRPAVFERQLGAIRRTHTIVPLDEAIRRFRTGARLARPLAAITFDDAYVTVAAFAAPVLADAAAEATCFVSTGVVGPSARFAHDRDNPVRGLLGVLGWPELARLSTAGWTLGAHTVTHPRLSQCDGQTLEREIAEPMEALRAHVALRDVPFAYPFGGEQDITALGRHLVGKLGYSACLSDFGGENHPSGDPLAMRRIELGGDHSALAWRVRIHGLDLAALKPRWMQAARGSGVVHAA
jgi:peptidoglycan/xylan/chitin deacetylase (PgdA/CDA1 family)